MMTLETTKIRRPAKKARAITVLSTITVTDDERTPSRPANTQSYEQNIRQIGTVASDEANKNGGKWIIRLRKGLASRFWENIILAMLGEQFMVGEEICGVVVSIRFQEDILSIWNKTANDQVTTSRIRDTLRRCPRCLQEQAKIVMDQRAVCKLCSKALRRVYQFCWACQREWQGKTGSNSCDLPWCGLRAALLSSDVITDQKSSVNECPFFRACPSCKALLTHSGEGCPNIVCPDCHTEFCFRCLSEHCTGNGYFYDSDMDDDSSNYDDDGEDDENNDLFGAVGDYCKVCTIVNNTEAIKELGI
ncbi:hypothetical protein JZ751_022825 [Albula glossodonta]|uniref:IBR domain-containing protein n=1 Tax=Albula glossodonta TaxID=121402 RepID=A0A8T2PGD7_9TELE|nr:hypothetical protein JZ751_022825 [Albula glossodonta]